MEPAPVGMTGHERFDVAVIGGGPVGLAAAHELALAGRSVVLLDRDDATGGCATGSAGFIVPSMIAPLAGRGAIAEFLRATVRRRDSISIRPTFRTSDWWWLARFARSCLPGSPTADRAVWSATEALADLSAQIIEGWVGEYAIDCAWQRRGVLDVYTDESRLADAVRTADEAAAAFGIPAEAVDGARARVLEPTLTDAIIGGVFHPADANVHPGRFLAGLGRAVVARGVDVRRGVDVSGWTAVGGSGFELATGRGRVHAAHIVIAAGVASRSFEHVLGIRVPIVGARGFSITGAATGLEPSMPLLLGERHIAVAPMGDEWRISGGFQLLGDEHGLRPTEQSRLLETVRERVAVDFAPLVRGWSGMRPVAADGVPIIGHAPGCPGVVLATGHHMGGLSFGAATGRVVAQLVTGQTPELDLRPFRPERFVRS